MPWKAGKRWVYSITYDEGLEALLDNALPVHRKYGIPGHVAVVASQLGVIRRIPVDPSDEPRCSYDGMLTLSPAQIAMLCAEGWGVSNHSMTHPAITPQNVRYEVIESRRVLEEALGMEVRMFCVPGCNEWYEVVRSVAQEAGLSAIMTIYDDINRQDGDLLRLCRVPLHEEYPPPFYSAYDPYKRLHQAADEGGWIIDYCHCPLPGRVMHRWKDCTLEHLAERFEAVLEVGGDDVWLAEPNEVVEYLMNTREGDCHD